MTSELVLPLAPDAVKIQMQCFRDKSIATADPLSRAPVRKEEPAETLARKEVQPFTVGAVLGLRSSTLNPVKKAREKDKICQTLREYCINEWPSKSRLAVDVSLFWQYRRSLSHYEGSLLCGSRLLIPGSLREHALKRHHEGQQKTCRCRHRTKEKLSRCLAYLPS